MGRLLARLVTLLTLPPDHEPGGWLWVRGALAWLWLTFMAAAWLVPNACSVWVRLGLTAWMSLLCGGIAAGTYRREREALREHRRENGLCLGCGYDLRATAGWCPECGAMEAPGGSPA